MAKAVHTPEMRKEYHDHIPLNRYGLEEELAEAINSEPVVDFKDAEGNNWRYHVATRKLTWEKPSKPDNRVVQKWKDLKHQRKLNRMMKRIGN